MAITALAPDRPTLAALDRLYICRACGRDDVPYEEMTKVSKNSTGVGSKCLSCNRTYRLAQAHRLASTDRGADGTVVEPVSETDPEPARLLAELMLYDRTFGLGFEQAWSDNVGFVLERIDGYGKLRERDQWRQAFESQRSAWRAAWERQPGPGAGLSPALLDALDAVGGRDVLLG